MIEQSAHPEPSRPQAELSRDQTELSHRFPDVTWAMVAAELRREAAARQRTYPALVDKARMSQAEADYQHALVAALAADLELMRAARPPRDATHPFSWLQRRDAIHRELDQRARFYPQWIATGRLTAADAAHRIRCLEALLERYDEGWGWEPEHAYPPLLERSLREHDDWLAEWTAAWRITRTCAARAGAQQQELMV